MKRYVPLLLLAAVIGCAKSETPTATSEAVSPEATTGEVGAVETASTKDSLELPAATATLVKFTCPGMT